MTINIKSVITSGLVAGIAINICGVVLVPIIGKEMDIALENRGLLPLGAGAMAYFGIMSLILGIFIVWLYAGARPRLGSKLKTVVIISSIVWFFTYFVVECINGCNWFYAIKDYNNWNSMGVG